MAAARFCQSGDAFDDLSAHSSRAFLRHCETDGILFLILVRYIRFILPAIHQRNNGPVGGEIVMMIQLEPIEELVRVGIESRSDLAPRGPRMTVGNEAHGFNNGDPISRFLLGLLGLLVGFDVDNVVFRD